MIMMELVTRKVTSLSPVVPHVDLSLGSILCCKGHWQRSLGKGCGRCYWTLASLQKIYAPSYKRVKAGDGVNFQSGLEVQRKDLEKLWQDLFSNPSQWWDNRAEKVNPRYPDFKHKETQEALWVNDKLNPPWVEAELDAMAPGTVKAGIFTWNKKITRYAKSGEYEKTMELFQQMQQEGLNPDKFTFVQVLNACSRVRALEQGRKIHLQITQTAHAADLYVGSCLVDMYAKCGSIEDARRVFDRMPRRNVVSWTAMILGYVKCGEGEKALQLSRQMQQEGLDPDPVTFVGMLNACASVGALKEGRRVHQQIIKRGYESDLFLGNALVDMYAKCGSIEDAQSVFNNMARHDVVSWTAMILGYVKRGEGHKALELSQQMDREGVQPDPVTFAGLLNACASIRGLEEGRRIHQQIMQYGHDSDVFVGSSLVDMYLKCGSVKEAVAVFDNMPIKNVVVWNAMILGHVKCGQAQKGLELFHRMQLEAVEPDRVTFMGVLDACASVASLEEGRRVHEQIIKTGCEFDVFVGNSLVDMYSKCESIEDALSVFNSMPTRDVVSWNAMVLGYVKCGQGQKALELSRQMQLEGVELDTATFVALLNACASIGALEEGRRIHEWIVESGSEFDVSLVSCLVDMYAKCGSLEDAQRVFHKLPRHNLVSWTAMIGGYALHGCAKEALELFESMSQEGVEMNEATFAGLLSACSHGRLVDEALHLFESMSSNHHVSPAEEHYSCVIDLLGRAKRLPEAEELVGTISCEASAGVWRSLLRACRAGDGNLEMGERIAKQLLELEPQDSRGYVLLSNIYAASGKWESHAIVNQQRLEREVKQQPPGCTWIEVNNELHSFTTDDSKHPQVVEIYAELRRISEQMKDAGYVPDTRLALHDVEDEGDEFLLDHHSEKLAIVFGLINTAPGTPLFIFKSQSVCRDCHTAIKFISKIDGRAINLRDPSLFHHFQGGLCSCGDYW